MTLTMLIMAFSMGFFGSPHCLGMCGGIVTAFGLSMQSITPQKKSLLIIAYHFGRLCSYAFLGLVAGFLGTAVLQPLLTNNMPRILLGLVLALVGLSMLGLPFLNKLEQVGGKLWQQMSPIRQKLFPLDTFTKAFSAGLLWGFLPCGLVYGALMMAVVGHDSFTGAMLMFVFGLGTLPMLLATQTTVLALKQRIKQFRLRQINGVIMTLSGVAVIAIPIAMHSFGGHDHSHQHTHTVTEPTAQINNQSTPDHSPATSHNHAEHMHQH